MGNWTIDHELGKPGGPYYLVRQDETGCWLCLTNAGAPVATTRWQSA